jgi:hypothetical protein
LGDAQDRAAHAALIRELALELASVSPPGRDPSSARALLAAGGLIERHRNRGRKVQAQARDAFRAFDTAENRARLRGLVPGSTPPLSAIDGEGPGGLDVEAGAEPAAGRGPADAAVAGNPLPRVEVEIEVEAGA